jgi:hypothetical protein
MYRIEESHLKTKILNPKNFNILDSYILKTNPDKRMIYIYKYYAHNPEYYINTYLDIDFTNYTIKIISELSTNNNTIKKIDTVDILQVYLNDRLPENKLHLPQIKKVRALLKKIVQYTHRINKGLTPEQSKKYRKNIFSILGFFALTDWNVWQDLMFTYCSKALEGLN